MSSIFGVTVARLCRIRSGTVGDELPFPLDADGFLDRSAVEDGTGDRIEPGALVTTRIASSTGALVLLGEPGLGKTTEFKQLAAADAGSGGEVVEVNAADLTADSFGELLGQRLRQLPVKQ